MSLSEELRRTVKGRGIKQVELARALGVHEAHVSRMLNNKKGVSSRLWEKAATYLNMEWQLVEKSDKE